MVRVVTFVIQIFKQNHAIKQLLKFNRRPAAIASHAKHAHSQLYIYLLENKSFVDRGGTFVRSLTPRFHPEKLENVIDFIDSDQTIKRVSTLV